MDLLGALILLKISQGKFSMIFSSCPVIGLCGVDFVGEGAEVNFLAVELNSDFPLLLNFVPFETFVFRAGLCFRLGAIAEVLGDGRGADVCVSIVEAFAVYVVADHFGGDMNNFAVHPDFLSGAFAPAGLPAGGV